jgi:hypothetical protein
MDASRARHRERRIGLRGEQVVQHRRDEGPHPLADIAAVVIARNSHLIDASLQFSGKVAAF